MKRQVLGRADSPAHHAEQVQIALRLLDQGKITLPPQITHLHLVALLQSGLALDLPDGSQLMIGVLRPESPWVGKTIQAGILKESTIRPEILAIFRGKSVMPARPETVLQPGDRLLSITPQQAQSELTRHLAALGPQTDTAVTS